MKGNLEILENLTILYAEDDKNIRENITRSLKMIFGKVYEVKDGMEALDIFDKKSVDVVLLDYVMPFMTGYDVAKEIRTRDKTIPIIIASAFTDKEKLLNAIELNLVKYLEKPIMYENLKEVFVKVIEVLKENNRLQIMLEDRIFYNYVTKTLKVDENEIQLSKNEIQFIELLLTKRNQLFSKERIEDEVFGKSVDENTLRNLIYRLRKKLNSDLIVTVKELGYFIK